AHEFQHMINAARRLYVNSAPDFEEVWLDEGLSHVAEEAMFYQGSGFGPGQNLDVNDVGGSAAATDAFFKYAYDDFTRLREWLVSPTASGPFQDDDDLATRGAAWAFLRYASDRDGRNPSAFFSALLNSTTSGTANLQAVLGTDPLPWARDWTAAMYADDAGIGTAAPYTNPSWNFRSLYANLDYSPGPACSCAYELAVRDPSNGVADAFSLAEGGAAAYARVGVSPGAFAGVRILSGGVTPPSTVRVTVIRRE
ncbi:MAG TPA: hypothetical protein VFQ39_01745, partial [Longimicrobium sp.]|nr:hypothetical protein [Longimicrobium sp.]